MAKTTLIIGIGSTGLNIIEEAQQYHYEFIGKNKPGKNVEYLYLETDISNKSRSTAGGKSKINPVFVDFTDIDVDIKQYRKKMGPKVEWIPPVEYLESGNIGAGGMPAFGRLSMWKKYNFDNLKSTILNKFSAINGDSSTLIYVVGTLTGGTGSGLSVDIAYLLQEILPQCANNIQALFLLPDEASFSKNKSLHENTFSALSAIDHYTKIGNDFNIKWPDGTPEKTFTSPPYQMVQFLSQNFSNGNAPIRNLGELVKVAGMRVLMSILNTNTTSDNLFESVLSKRRADQHGNGTFDTYNSFGFKMIQYPKAQLKELLSITISSKLINSVVDAENFITKSGAKKPIVSQLKTFQKNSIDDFEKIIESSLSIFDNITTPEGMIISEDMENIVGQIISGKLLKDDKGEMHSKFNTVNTNSYYGLFSSNSSIFRNSMIDQLNDYAESVTERYKNLVITRLHIEKIADYIDELIVFYADRYKLNGDENKWDNFLGIKIDELFQHKVDFDLTFTKRKYYNFIMLQLKEVLKLQTIIPELLKLKRQLQSNTLTKSLKGNILPSIEYINTSINTYNELANGDDIRMTLNKRKISLKASLEKYSTSFKMLFETGSMNSDLQNALDKYDRSDTKIGFNQLLGTSIWNFVMQDYDQIYRKSIDNSVGFINEQDLFSSSLIEIINRIDPRENNDNLALTELFSANETILKGEIPAMFLRHRDFTLDSDAYSKLLIVSSDHNKYSELFKDYEIGAINSNSVDLTGLNDVIVLYQEYATTTNSDDVTLNPLRHIGYMPIIKDHIKSKVKADNKTNSFFIKKFPYLTKEELKKYTS